MFDPIYGVCEECDDLNENHRTTLARITACAVQRGSNVQNWIKPECDH